jgi:hypothetical protein
VPCASVAVIDLSVGSSQTRRAVRGAFTRVRADAADREPHTSHRAACAEQLHPALFRARSELTSRVIGPTFYGVSMSVYVDHAFAVGDWGRWSGGGHLQADALAELHSFAVRLGLRREWFQTTPGRPEKDHYDLTQAGREYALALGAIAEDRRAGTRRRQAIRTSGTNRQLAAGPAITGQI